MSINFTILITRFESDFRALVPLFFGSRLSPLSTIKCKQIALLLLNDLKRESFYLFIAIVRTWRLSSYSSSPQQLLFSRIFSDFVYSCQTAISNCFRWNFAAPLAAVAETDCQIGQKRYEKHKKQNETTERKENHFGCARDIFTHRICHTFLYTQLESIMYSKSSNKRDSVFFSFLSSHTGTGDQSKRDEKMECWKAHVQLYSRFGRFEGANARSVVFHFVMNGNNFLRFKCIFNL